MNISSPTLPTTAFPAAWPIIAGNEERKSCSLRKTHVHQVPAGQRRSRGKRCRNDSHQLLRTALESQETERVVKEDEYEGSRCAARLGTDLSGAGPGQEERSDER